MRLNFLIATMRISSSQDIICIMLWLTSYIFSDFVLFYFCGDSCLIPYKSLPPSVSRPMTVLKWQTHGSLCPSLCLFSPSASTYYTMLMSVSTTVYELIERRLYITASFHQTELVYLYVLCCAKLLHLVRLFAMGHSLPGSSVHGILQTRILEWVAVPSSRGSSWPRGRTHISCVSCAGRRVLYL